ncbi:ABC transporter substrate-binding protein [uncultured Aureimonas sp.]|uniref:ABC transporter substrate-binding protein n=1 Tax=uncultured Aureimonas sp. TaxID=1604662 RepID=UPI0025E7BBF2|nr:ABC transporter substrate-binding protein [uncultured Aureimonas sp.]
MTTGPKDRIPSLVMDRRAILKASAVAGASLFVPGLGVMAFAQGAPQPQRGGHLILGLDTASSSDSLDPALYTEAYMYTVGFQLFNTLVEIDETGKIVPSLAESFEPVKADGSAWRFKLRPGVQFHNGKELTAADVIYSINHHRGADSPSGGKGQLLAVTDLKAEGTNAVVFELSSGNVDFPAALTDYHLGIGPEGGDFAKGVGTGAFQLESFQPGVRALTKRFSNHWNPNRGFVDSVETLAMNDATARLAAVISGQVHAINRVEPRMLARIKAMPQVTVHSTTASTMHCFPMRLDQKPFDNPDARLALKYAIDREAIVKTVMGGVGQVGNDNPIAPWNPYFAADLPKHTYDPDKARFQAQKAGLSGPIQLSAADNGFPGAVDAAQLFQVSAKAAGIDISVNRVPSDGYWDEVWMKHAFCASNWSVRPTADAMLSLVFASDAPWNETGWKRPDFDAKLIAARSEFDEAKRKQLYHDLQLMLVEDGGEIIHAFADSQVATSAKLVGVTDVPGGGDLSGYRLPEKVWFAS